MDIAFYVDILDASGAKLGTGPIKNLTSWRSSKRLSRAGSFAFDMLLSDPNRDIIQEKRVAKCTAVTDTGPVVIGSGTIDEITTIPRKGGNVALRVAGPDLLGELNYRSMLSQSIDGTHAASITQLQSTSPSGWLFAPEFSAPNNDIYHQYRNETVLAGCIEMAEESGTQFYLVPDRNVVFSALWSDTGIRAIEPPIEPYYDNENICFIANIKYLDSSQNFASRIYPFGSEGVSLSHTTRTAPAGYTLDAAAGYIVDDSFEVAYGRIERVENFYEVERIGTDPSDDVSAANTLFDLALAELKRSTVVRRDYQLVLMNCLQILRPMQQIRCIFRRLAHGRVIEDVDEVLNIIDVNTVVDKKGLRTTRINVSTVGHQPKRDTDLLVKLAQERRY